MEPIAKAGAQAPWKVCGTRQGLFWGVSTLSGGSVQSPAAGCVGGGGRTGPMVRCLLRI